MKKVLLVMSLISVLLLAGCNKDNNIVNNSVVDNTDNQQQEIIQHRGYSNEELIEMVKAYRKTKGEYIPSIVEVEEENDNIVTIHLYDIVDDHTSTSDWYYINRLTGIGENLNGESINLNIENAIVGNNEDEYQEITEELLTNCEGIYVTNVVKNENDTYTLQGTLFGDYLLTDEEFLNIKNKGKMEVDGKEWTLKLNEYASEEKYYLTDENNRYEFEISRLENGDWQLVHATQIWQYYKSMDVQAQITVDKDTPCYEYRMDEEGMTKTVEDTFSDFQSCIAPNDIGVGKIWNLEMKDGKCVKLNRFLGL